MRRRLFTLFACLCLILTPCVLADTAGPSNPSTVAQVDAGGNAFDTPNNILTSNNSRASSSTVGGTTDRLKATNFGFAIPAGATINGVTVGIERLCSVSSSGSDLEVKLIKADGTLGSTDRSTATVYPTGDAYEDHGGASDTWGEALSPSDINDADFGVAYRGQGSAGGVIRIDHIRITVAYTPSVVRPRKRVYVTRSTGAISSPASNSPAFGRD